MRGPRAVVSPARTCRTLSPLRRRRAGQVLPLAAAALTGLLGCVAMTVDVGRVLMAGSIAQDHADAAVLGGAPLLGESPAAISAAQSLIAINRATAGGFAVTCEYSPSGASDIVYFPPGSAVPGYGTLGPGSRALSATTHITLATTFARALGILSRQVDRRAVSVYGPVSGVPIMPMWVSDSTPYELEQTLNLLMADGPHYADIPGNFGFLQVPPDCSASWSDVMSGSAELSEEDWEALYVAVGSSVYGLTGLRTGQWVDALRERMARADEGWSGQTYSDHESTNPRILLIPLVTYLGGAGSNAAFRIERFGAFWLESVSHGGHNKSINGTFIEYVDPEATLDAFGPDTGIYTYRLIG